MGEKTPNTQKRIQVEVAKSNLLLPNAVFGSRFHRDFLFSVPTTDSGTLGTFNSKPDKPYTPYNYIHQEEFTISLRKGSSTISFPTDANPHFQATKLELGMATSRMTAEESGLEISLETDMHFYPQAELSDDYIKDVTGPFMYHALTIRNTSDHEVRAEMLVSASGIESVEVHDGFVYLYLPDHYETSQTGIDHEVDGRRALVLRADRWKLEDDAAVLEFSLGPNECLEELVVDCGYNDTPVMYDSYSKENLFFYYTTLFEDIKEVARFAFDNHGRLSNLRGQFEKRVEDSGMDDEAVWVNALAFHTYLANTWLVHNPQSDQKRYYVWEGSGICCQLVSTVDVAHEVSVFEGSEIPWALRMQLDEWAERTLELPGYGTYVQHDLGRFHKIQEIAYYTTWIKRHMATEENANYILLLNWYWHNTGDDAFVESKLELVSELVDFMKSRDSTGTGISDVGFGKDRKGEDSEKTTYDQSNALQYGKDNTYLGIKQMSAYIAAARMFTRFGRQDESEKAGAEAEKIKSVVKAAIEERGYLPVVLDRSYPGWDSDLSVQSEGLLYLALTGPVPEIADIIPLLSDSYQHAYEACTDAYAIRLASDEPISWLSKTAVADIVSQLLFDFKTDSTGFAYTLLRNNPDKGFTDAFQETSKLVEQKELDIYPRGVSFYGFYLLEKMKLQGQG